MENREILSYFDILAFSKCILYFDILVVFRILILKFSRIRSQALLLCMVGAMAVKVSPVQKARLAGWIDPWAGAVGENQMEN